MTDLQERKPEEWRGTSNPAKESADPQSASQPAPGAKLAILYPMLEYWDVALISACFFPRFSLETDK